MIPIYEQIQRAKKGAVIYTDRPARNATSAASRLGRKVKTEVCLIYPMHSMSDPKRLLRVTVLK